jgi:haloacid dehalogenase superfamily, subfamily IA, variant 3 with third motif having DD or ED/beta-phosphoglucomutase family hydrolase
MADGSRIVKGLVVQDGMTTLEWARFGAALFDLDGVVTKTARVHASAWQHLFNEYLQSYSVRTGRPFRPFDIEQDYRVYVDGKPRYEGVKSFLDSREIVLPWGTPEDGPREDTIYGLGNKKDGYFETYLKEAGVEVYEGTVRFLHVARDRGLKTAVVSSSSHCKQVVEAAGLTELFDTRVDGLETQRLHLRGNPAPDTFLEAARRLGVHPEQAMVIEDAQAGVAAGRAGGFGLVIGLDRRRQADALRQQGADIVANDLSELLPQDQQT